MYRKITADVLTRQEWLGTVNDCKLFRPFGKEWNVKKSNLPMTDRYFNS